MEEFRFSVLGKNTGYTANYDKDLLFKVPRLPKRKELGLDNSYKFYGYDVWNAYEISWLNHKNKPYVAIAEIIYDAHSTYIVESKSLKLYLNSFNNHHFANIEEVTEVIKTDLSLLLETDVKVKLYDVDDNYHIRKPRGHSIDNLDVECFLDFKGGSILQTIGDQIIHEELYSNLLKSNCLITNQPDWATIEISYKGKKIHRESLLQYIVSLRNHNEFHEQCVERIFYDILYYTNPESLKVSARYTRRGGIDINPIRCTPDIYDNITIDNLRLSRQ